MGSRSRALFLGLLEDFSGILDTDTLDLLRSGVNVEPWPDITPKEFKALALARSVFAKCKDNVERDADANALAEFLRVNNTSGSWELNFVDSWDEVLWGELKNSLANFWVPNGTPHGYPLVTTFEDLFDRGRCGPGGSLGVSFHDFYSKLFSSNLTTTRESLYRAYRCYVKRYPEWAIAEDFRLAKYGVADIVEGNRLGFVPKKRSISRTTCTEPVVNMFLQLGMGGILEDRLASFFGIRLRDQQVINRDLARLGSLYQSYCTIDLKTASDSIATEMLRSALPRDFFSWLELLRSPTCELPDGSRVALNMISTMGNGFTFPLQTMLFASAVTAAARARGFHLERPRADSECSFGVFGDDIIVSMHCHYSQDRKIFQNYGGVLVQDVLRLLRLMGFTVNSSKSFFEGPFRESCGADFFRGQFVRGAYIKTLKTPQNRFVAINLLNRWSAYTGIPVTRAVTTLSRSVPEFLVPAWESDDSGIKVPFSLVKHRRLDPNVQAIKYRKFVMVKETMAIDEATTSFIVEKRDGTFGEAKLVYNPSGLLIAFLNGTIRSDSIGLRSKFKRYRGCYGLAPNWDELSTSNWLPGVLPDQRDVDRPPWWEETEVVPANAGGLRWNTAVSRNLKT